MLTKLFTEDDSVLLKLTNLLTDPEVKNEFFSQINDLNTTWHESSNIKPLFTHCLLNDLPGLNLDLKDPNLKPLKTPNKEGGTDSSPERLSKDIPMLKKKIQLLEVKNLKDPTQLMMQYHQLILVQI